jgi:hypothetical protein
MKITFVVAMLAATFALNSISAQAQNVRVRGTIEKLDGNNLAVKSRDGAELKLVLKDNVRIGGVVKASLADVKADANVAITSRPRPDGTLEAVELLHLSRRAALQLIPCRLGLDAEQLHDQRLIANLGLRRRRPGADGEVQGPGQVR